MGSQLVAVRSAVINGLTAAYSATSLDGVDTGFQWNVKWSRRERIWTRRARATHDPASLRAGKNFRKEAGAFDLCVYVERPAKDAEATAERAMEIGLVLEDFIANHKNNDTGGGNFWVNLGVEGLTWIEVKGDVELIEAFGDGSTLAELTIPISYSARLT